MPQKELQIAKALNPDYLNLILFPTEQCNFRCSYCYEHFEIGRMSSKIIHGVKQLLSKRLPDLRHLSLSWFGGEPLLAKDIILDISRHVLHIKEQHSELIYDADITTNGYLLDIETLKTLVSVGVNYFHISLDGSQPLHDQTRLTINGKGSFDVIWKRLLDIKNEPNIVANVMLRLHFLPNTWREMLHLVDMINADFAEDPRFTVYFKAIEHLGGVHDSSIRTFTEESQELLIKFLESHLKYSRMLSNLAHQPDYVCYASQANSIAVRANGDLAKCTVALYDEKNRVGKLQENGDVIIDNPRFRRWLVGLQTGDDVDLACPYSRMQSLIKPDDIREGLPEDALYLIDKMNRTDAKVW